MQIRIIFTSLFAVLLFLACGQNTKELPKDLPLTMSKENYETITLGAGCFWCVEAVFQELEGVYKVEAGYAGGEIKDPSYKQVASGNTEHAEVAQITFDPDVISLEEILEVFWSAHNPTTLNRQGPDVGPQYRSAVFYHNEKQKEIAKRSKKEVATKVWDDPIVTEITPLKNYSKAENYHQNYYANNPNQRYCQAVIAPKLKKVREKFADKLKKEPSQ